MTKAGQITFEAAKEEVLSAAPPRFTFSNPPSIGWWRAKLDVGLPAVAFIHHYQPIMGANAMYRVGAFGQTEVAARWQAAAGITSKQWQGVKAELGTGGTQMLSFCIHVINSRKCTWIRPSDQLLAVFGITLKTYDAVSGLDLLISRQAGWEKESSTPFRPLSQDEADALALWTSRGGLARLRNAELLGELLETFNATQSPVHA
jgi:hypothetical protein